MTPVCLDLWSLSLGLTKVVLRVCYQSYTYVDSESLSCENNNISLFSALPESSNMYSNKDSNLISDLRDNYGENSVSLFRKWENTTKKMADYRNHRRFTLKCIKASITPVSCKIKAPSLLDLKEVIKSSTKLKNNSYMNVLET